MKPQDLSKWTDIDGLEGLLVFAEAIDELLFDHTLDSFKSPALNLHLSILEVRSLLMLLLSERVYPESLKHAISELGYHLHHDPASPRPVPDVWAQYYDRLKDLGSNPKRLFHNADALLVDVGRRYWQTLKAAICSAVTRPREKKLIQSLARAFTTESELLGFSKRYVYFENQRFFFSKVYGPRKISDPSQVADFLKRFEQEPKKRKVVFRCTQRFTDFRDHSEVFGIRIDTGPPEIGAIGPKVDEFLRPSERFPGYAIVSLARARDELGATSIARRRLDLFTDVCKFADHNAELEIQPTALAADDDWQNTRVVKPAPNPMTCHALRSEVEISSIVEQSTQLLAGLHFGEGLRRAFQKVLEYHESALSAKSPENQLVSLWSCLEGFLPPPKDRISRIDAYLSALLPILTVTYSRKVLGEVAACLKHTSSRVSDLVDGLEVAGEFEDKATALLTCLEFDEQRKELGRLIDYSPLLRNRCFWCYDSFRSRKAVRSTLRMHIERLEWHIRRIYATRNQIVHSAECLPYVDTLVENLHSYIDILIDSVVRTGKAAEQLAEIDTILTVLRTHFETYLTMLSAGDEECNLLNYQDILYSGRLPSRD